MALLETSIVSSLPSSRIQKPSDFFFLVHSQDDDDGVYSTVQKVVAAKDSIVDVDIFTAYSSTRDKQERGTRWMM